MALVVRGEPDFGSPAVNHPTGDTHAAAALSAQGAAPPLAGRSKPAHRDRGCACRSDRCRDTSSDHAYGELAMGARGRVRRRGGGGPLRACGLEPGTAGPPRAQSRACSSACRRRARSRARWTCPTHVHFDRPSRCRQTASRSSFIGARARRQRGRIAATSGRRVPAAATPRAAAVCAGDGSIERDADRGNGVGGEPVLLARWAVGRLLAGWPRQAGRTRSPAS